MFRSLRLYNFRVWTIGALVSNVGSWMQATAQDWVVLTELTDRDATAMGFTMALQFGPPLVLAGLTGALADRVDRRKILYFTQTILMLLALITAALLLTGVMTLPLMFVIAACFGVTNAFDAPARQALVTDVVSREHASNAVALNAASFNAARLIGPAMGGLFIVAVGTGWVFVINAATFLAMLIALAMMRTAELVPQARSKQGSGGMMVGIRYVWGRSDLKVALIIVFIIGAFGMNFPIFASTMALEFGRQADGYGLLSSILAIGSLAGALLAARRDRARLRMVILASGLFGITSLISAGMPTYWTYAIVQIFVGFSVVTMMTTANGYIQTTTDPALRGRVMALYMAVIMGSTPVGAPIAGWVVDTFGPRAAILLAGISGIVTLIIGVVWMLTSGRVRRTPGTTFRIAVDETVPVSLPKPTDFIESPIMTTPIRLPKHQRDNPGDL